MSRSIAVCLFLLTSFSPHGVNAENQTVGTPISLVVGEAQFFNADYIEILSVTSSGKGFEIGATVIVEGVYTLNSAEAAQLAFYSTTMRKTGEKPASTPIQKSQRTRAIRGKHIFKLSKVIENDGKPHLTFYVEKKGKPFGGVYFGDESNVLMKKSWSYEPRQTK